MRGHKVQCKSIISIILIGSPLFCTEWAKWHIYFKWDFVITLRSFIERISVNLCTVAVNVHGVSLETAHSRNKLVPFCVIYKACYHWKQCLCQREIQGTRVEKTITITHTNFPDTMFWMKHHLINFNLKSRIIVGFVRAPTIHSWNLTQYTVCSSLLSLKECWVKTVCWIKIRIL